MRRLVSIKRTDAFTVVTRHYETDTAHVAKALLVVLRWREAHPPANEGTVEERETETTRSNAPAGEPTGAQDHTSTVISSATSNQGIGDDTTYDTFEP